MEWIDIKSGYWDEACDHVLRSEFLKEAKRMYDYVTVYVHVHRIVIANRKERVESVKLYKNTTQIKVDYYRISHRS